MVLGPGRAAKHGGLAIYTAALKRRFPENHSAISAEKHLPSPATGFPGLAKLEQQAIIAQALGPPAVRKGKAAAG